MLQASGWHRPDRYQQIRQIEAFPNTFPNSSSSWSIIPSPVISSSTELLLSLSSWALDVRHIRKTELAPFAVKHGHGRYNVFQGKFSGQLLEVSLRRVWSLYIIGLVLPERRSLSSLAFHSLDLSLCMLSFATVQCLLNWVSSHIKDLKPSSASLMKRKTIGRWETIVLLI